MNAPIIAGALFCASALLAASCYWIGRLDEARRWRIASSTHGLVKSGNRRFRVTAAGTSAPKQ